MADTNVYGEALQKAQDELAQIEARREVLLKVIANLSELAGEEMWELTPPPGYEPKGLTAEIRKILGLTMNHLNAVQIRDALIQRGFTAFKNPKNLLICVHTVLDRIQKELDVIQRDEKAAYKMKVAKNPAAGFLLGNLGINPTEIAAFVDNMRKAEQAAANQIASFSEAVNKLARESALPELNSRYTPGTVISDVKKK